MQNTIFETFNGIGVWLKSISIDIALIVAGTFGGMLNLNKESKQTVWQKFIAVASGGACANYITPVFISFLHIGDSTKFGIAFIVGYMGLKSVELTIGKIKNKLEEK
jgi:hypothetical protein